MFWRRKKEEPKFSDDTKDIVKYVWKCTVNCSARWYWDGVTHRFGIKFAWDCRDLGCSFRLIPDEKGGFSFLIKRLKDKICVADLDAGLFQAALLQALEPETGEIETPPNCLKLMHEMLMDRLNRASKKMTHGTMRQIANKIRKLEGEK